MLGWVCGHCAVPASSQRGSGLETRTEVAVQTAVNITQNAHSAALGTHFSWWQFQTHQADVEGLAPKLALKRSCSPAGAEGRGSGRSQVVTTGHQAEQVSPWATAPPSAGTTCAR